jgi:hypothetical protein
VVRARAEDGEAHSLARRVVRLRSDYLAFPVPDHILRKAMIELASPRSISTPLRKMKHIHAAGDHWEAFVRPPDPQLGRARRRPQVHLPPPTAWRDVLRNRAVSQETFKGQATHSYYLNYLYTTNGLPEWPDESVTPLEERVLILMVIALSRRPHESGGAGE